MVKVSKAYSFIQEKINQLRGSYPFLTDKPDSFVFSVLCIKALFYKNPSDELEESDLKKMIVDGKADGGVDFLLSLPHSENSDLILGQSKFKQKITREEIEQAVQKMISFYKEMKEGHFEKIRNDVQTRFNLLEAEESEDSEIRFVFCTSAPKSRIDVQLIERKFEELSKSLDKKASLEVYFSGDIGEHIQESEARRPSVEAGEIKIDKPNNCLTYGEDACIVNVSAFSIKKLYATYHTTLLARNLRYHVTGREIDNEIAKTIQSDKESFWRKNNGLTVICDDFCIVGDSVKLSNFSIVNGGQTTHMLHKSEALTQSDDLYLPCKIIRVLGKDEKEKNEFILSIAKATNSQKAIKSIDLKANSAEQLIFASAMRDAGVFYQTKRGEKIPKGFKESYLNTDLLEVGKLSLAGLLQFPCSSRNKPSMVFNPKFYKKIFDNNPRNVAKLAKELLFLDTYFRKEYQPSYAIEHKDDPRLDVKTPFVNNARTVCIAFAVLAGRYMQGNITAKTMKPIFSDRTPVSPDDIFNAFNGFGNLEFLIQKDFVKQKDTYKEIVKRLFDLFIKSGVQEFSSKSRNNAISATNFLKNDQNYWEILAVRWDDLEEGINEILGK